MRQCRVVGWGSGLVPTPRKAAGARLRLGASGKNTPTRNLWLAAPSAASSRVGGRMSTRNFARIFGIVFLLIGVAGFGPPLLQPAQGGAIAPGVPHMLLFGMFPMNALHNAVHIGFGLWGLAASRAQRSALLYARGVAIAYILMWGAGFVPGLDDMFGILPL